MSICNTDCIMAAMPFELESPNVFAFIYVLKRVGTSSIILNIVLTMSRRRHARDKSIINLFENSGDDDEGADTHTSEALFTAVKSSIFPRKSFALLVLLMINIFFTVYI